MISARSKFPAIIATWRCGKEKSTGDRQEQNVIQGKKKMNIKYPVFYLTHCPNKCFKPFVLCCGGCVKSVCVQCSGHCTPACVVYKQINFDLHRKSVTVSISHGLHQPERLTSDTNQNGNPAGVGAIMLLRYLMAINIFSVAALGCGKKWFNPFSLTCQRCKVRYGYDNTHSNMQWFLDTKHTWKAVWLL